MNDFDIIRQDRRLLYEYIRGSHLYGINNKDSDTSSCYVCTSDELFGCFGYKSQVTPARCASSPTIRTVTRHIADSMQNTRSG